MIMKRYLLIIVLLQSMMGLSFAQVDIHYYYDSRSPRNLWNSVRSEVTVIEMASFDLTQIQKEDEERDRNPGLFRFGKAFDVCYTLADGVWKTVDGGRLWVMTFKSENALSLNYVFNNIYLPEGAELYIENADKTVQYGPVTKEAIPDNGLFLTDIIPGSQSTIILYEPSSVMGQSTLTIQRVVHGYRGLDLMGSEPTRDFSPRIACHSDYEVESDAVGLILASGGTEICSGALVMSADKSFKPYFLTAYSFVDGSGNGVSSSEIAAAENCAFLFRRKYTLCKNGTLLPGKSYNHATYRASWIDTGFALMEIHGDVRKNSDLSWLGWVRNTTDPTSGACIHYEMLGDLRIAFDTDHIYTDNSGISNGNGWYTSFDIGKPNYGTIGAPLLNENKRLVGQFFYYQANNYFSEAFAGKFNLSWTGGGTNSTRLSNWLDPNGSNINAIKTCRSLGGIDLIGDDVIINSNSIFYVDSLPSGCTVFWSLSDSYYNQYCLTQNSPSSNHCTITKNNTHSLIGATLTATIEKDGSTAQTLTKTISAKVFAGTYYNGVTTKQVNLPYPLYVKRNANLSLNSQNLVGATLTHEGNATVSQFSHNSSTGVLSLYFTSLGSRVVHVICTDGLQYDVPFIVTDNVNQLNLVIGDGQIEASVLPVGEEETRELSSDDSVADLVSSDTLVWTLEVYNATTGEKVFSQEVDGTNYIIDTTGWKPGVYVVRAVIGDEVLNEKVVVN